MGTNVSLLLFHQRRDFRRVGEIALGGFCKQCSFAHFKGESVFSRIICTALCFILWLDFTN